MGNTLGHHLQLQSMLDAVEASLEDQRQKLSLFSVNVGRDAYTQRLEFQGRISALDMELQNHFSAIEAGLADLRYAMLKLAGALGVGPAPAEGGAGQEEGAAARRAGELLLATISEARAEEIDRKLGLLLDCVLADHLAQAAEDSRRRGDLEQEACTRLQEALGALKIERLRDGHDPRDHAAAHDQEPK